MRKRTKIICTLGPASSSAKVISNLIKEGTDVFRINLSHSSIEQTAKIIKRSSPLNCVWLFLWLGLDFVNSI
jgi:pyruvate kinase